MDNLQTTGDPVKDILAKEYNNWGAELKALKLEWLKKISPDFFEASGGYSMKVDRYSDAKANDLTKAIHDFIKFTGGHATRINTQGQARVQRIPKFSLATGKVEHTEKVSYTKSTTRKGTADLHCIVAGCALSIEVKIGADRQSDEQKEEAKRVEAAGGIYFLAKDFPSFRQWYRETFQAVNNE